MVYLCALSSVFVFSYLCIYPRLKCCGQVELFKSPSVCWRYLQTFTHTKGYTFTSWRLPNTFSFKIFCRHLGWERKTPFLPASKVQRLFLRLYLLAGVQVSISRNQTKIKLPPSLLLCLLIQIAKPALFSERLVLEKQSALASPGGSESQQFVQVLNHQSVRGSNYLDLWILF